MLLIATSLRQLSFGQLMNVYQDANRENGSALAPFDSPEQQVLLAEQDFHNYLSGTFFSVPGAMYAIWVENGTYLSAARLEPYRDGLLLEALETAPAARRRGYALCLMQSIQAFLAHRGGVKLYSHVSKRNRPSLRVHEKCGFQIEKDCAVYIDGSVNANAYTLVYQKD